MENSRVKRPVSPGETEKEQRCTDGPISWCFLWTANGNGEEAVPLQKMHERKINSTEIQQILGKKLHETQARVLYGIFSKTAQLRV